MWSLLYLCFGLSIIPGWLGPEADLRLQVPLGFQNRQNRVATFSLLCILANRVRFVVVLDLILVVLRGDTLGLLVLSDVRLCGHLVVLLVLDEH